MQADVAAEVEGASRAARRATPLPADERRAALVAATLPLVRTHGSAVSTRQIAQAAGVAEGTIFRVFATKDELVNAALAEAFNPAHVAGDLVTVDRSLPVDERLVAATEIMQRRLTGLFHLMDAFGMRRLAGDPDAERARADRAASQAVVQAALTQLIEPDREVLRCEPAEVARRLRLLTFAGSHPGITGGNPLTPTEIVSTLLDGLRRRDGDQPC